MNPTLGNGATGDDENGIVDKCLIDEEASGQTEAVMDS